MTLAVGRESSGAAATFSRRATIGILGSAAVGSFALPVSAERPRRTKYFAPATYSVVDEFGNSPSGDTSRPTRLYDAYEYDASDPEASALLAPDGDHVTWGEFSDVNGSVTLKCVGKGTHVTVHGWDLFEEGLYTVWVAILDMSGPEEMVVGAAPLGNNDGSQSDFRASASGRGSIVSIDESGPLTADTSDDPKYAGYVTPDCLLDSEYTVEIAGAYHYDDTTHGSQPRPYGVEHFSVLF